MRTTVRIAQPVRQDRTRSELVIQRQAARRAARQAKRTPAPLDLNQLAAELGATVGVTR